MVFLVPPNLEELEKRLSGRGTEKSETMKTRLRNAKEEIALSARYDYVVVNDRIDRASGELTEIFKSEIRKSERGRDNDLL